MRADGEIDRQMLAALDRGEEHALEVRHLREVRAHGLARAQHQPAAADVALAGHGIDRIVDRGRDVGRAVVLMLHVKRQRGEVDVVPGDHHLLHRGVTLRDFDHGLRIFHPLRKFLRKLARVGAPEGRRIAAAASADRADDLEMLRSRILEQARLGRGLDHGADVGQARSAARGPRPRRDRPDARRSVAAGIFPDRCGRRMPLVSTRVRSQAVAAQRLLVRRCHPYQSNGNRDKHVSNRENLP